MTKQALSGGWSMLEQIGGDRGISPIAYIMRVMVLFLHVEKKQRF